MKAPVFKVYRAKDGWRWKLIAKNGRTIATGEAHRSERDAWRAVDSVRTAALYAAGGED